MMRKRKENFTEYEKVLILNLIEVHRDIVETKKNDSKTLHTKAQIWDTITETFNNDRGVRVHRFVTDLKDLYKRLKIEAKKQFTEYIRNLRATEGDEMKPPSPDSLSQKVYQIIPYEFEPRGNQSTDESEAIYITLNRTEGGVEDVSIKQLEERTQVPVTNTLGEAPSTSTNHAEDPKSNSTKTINHIAKAKRKLSDGSLDELMKIYAEEEHAFRMEYMREKKKAKMELLELKKQNELAKAELIAKQIKNLQESTSKPLENNSMTLEK